MIGITGTVQYRSQAREWKRRTVSLGRMMRQANWIPEARGAYQRALAMDPSLQAARVELAALPAEDVVKNQ